MSELRLATAVPLPGGRAEDEAWRPEREPQAGRTLSVTLRWLHVLVNGRPADAPRPMRVGLLCDVVGSLASGGREARLVPPALVPFFASVGSTVSGSLLVGGQRGGYPLVTRVEVPDLARVDILFVVAYQADMGPIQLDPRARIAFLPTDVETPPLPHGAAERLLLTGHGPLLEEYGRASLLVDGCAYGRPMEFVVPVQVTARTTILGPYVVPGSGEGDDRPRGPATFVAAGDVVATGEIGLSVEP